MSDTSHSPLRHIAKVCRFVTWPLMAAVLAAAHPAAALNLSSEQISSYLAARAKALSFDYSGAAEHYRELIAARPDDLFLLDEAMRIFMFEGNHRNALSAAVKLEENGVRNFLVGNLMLAADFRDGDYSGALARIDGLDAVIGPEMLAILNGWAHVGSGDIAAADTAFDAISENANVDLIEFHKSLALAARGDFEAAEMLMAGIADRNEVPRSIPDQLVLAWAQTLVQLDRRDDAVTLIDNFSQRPTTALARERIFDLRRRIEDREQVDFDFVSDPYEGVSKYYSAIARDLAADAQPRFQASVMFARVAEMLDPTDADTAFELGIYLGEIGSHEMAVFSFDMINAGDPVHYLAEIEKSNALRDLGRSQESIALLIDLAERHGGKVVVSMTLGYGWLEDKIYEEAESAFDKAVELTLASAPEDPESDGYRAYLAENWRPFYARAIARERVGDWERAKSDLTLAVESSGGNPYVLNYLGYSMLVQGEDPIEAEELIRKALEREPENGAFIDSLGWAQFLQGKYDEALPNLEKAVRLLPHTAEVIDHLGDVYWMVGRKREAEFQWRRALHFEDENVDADRVRRKLNVGLDQVLEEEEAVGGG